MLFFVITRKPRQNFSKNKTRSAQPTSKNNRYCRLCHRSNLPKEVYTSHNFADSSNKIPVHIDLDSGATLNYISESEVLKHNFKRHPNGQLSKLGDGVTKIKGIGEIHETFFRNNFKVKFSAIICKQLTSPMIGGTVFIKENGIEQDFVRDVIHIHNKTITVQPTDSLSLLPMAPIISPSAKVTTKPPSNILLSFKSRILLPGQSENLDIQQYDGETVAIEPVEHNNNTKWPDPQFQKVHHGKISIANNSTEAIILGKKGVQQCRVQLTEENISQRTTPWLFL